MTTFREFQDELERLHRQSETVRRQEKGAALETIKALIADYDLTLEELGLAPTTKPRARRAPAVPTADAERPPQT